MGSIANTLLPPRSILGMLYSFFYSPIGKTSFRATPHPFLGKSFLLHCSWPGSLCPTCFFHSFIHSFIPAHRNVLNLSVQEGHWRVESSGSQSSTAHFQPKEILPRKPSQGPWPVSSPGIIQGLEYYSKPEVKGKMGALSSFHFQESKASASLFCELLREG